MDLVFLSTLYLPIKIIFNRNNQAIKAQLFELSFNAHLFKSF